MLCRRDSSCDIQWFCLFLQVHPPKWNFGRYLHSFLCPKVVPCSLRKLFSQKKRVSLEKTYYPALCIIHCFIYWDACCCAARNRQIPLIVLSETSPATRTIKWSAFYHRLLAIALLTFHKPCKRNFSSASWPLARGTILWDLRISPNAVFSDVKPFNLVVVYRRVFYPLVCGISVNHNYPLDLCFRCLRNAIKYLQGLRRHIPEDNILLGLCRCPTPTPCCWTVFLNHWCALVWPGPMLKRSYIHCRYTERMQLQ
jgi:hypothetical protein